MPKPVSEYWVPGVTKEMESQYWGCELCGGTIKGKCWNTNGYVVHPWGDCVVDDDDRMPKEQYIRSVKKDIMESRRKYNHGSTAERLVHEKPAKYWTDARIKAWEKRVRASKRKWWSR